MIVNLDKKVELKLVGKEHLELLMNWRNSETVSQALFTSTHLTMEDQLRWYEKYKNDRGQIRWIILSDGKPIGTTYLTDIDTINKRCESGWFIPDREDRSMNLALTIRWNIFDYVFDTLKLHRQYGYILAENKGVVRFLRVGGFDIEGTMKEHVFKDGKYHDVIVAGITKEIWQDRKQQFQYKKIYIEER